MGSVTWCLPCTRAWPYWLIHICACTCVHEYTTVVRGSSTLLWVCVMQQMGNYVGNKFCAVCGGNKPDHQFVTDMSEFPVDLRDASLCIACHKVRTKRMKSCLHYPPPPKIVMAIAYVTSSFKVCNLKRAATPRRRFAKKVLLVSTINISMSIDACEF